MGCCELHLSTAHDESRSDLLWCPLKWEVKMARKTTMIKNPGIDEHSVLRRGSSRFQRVEVSHPSVSRGPRAQSTVLPLVLGRGSCSMPDARRSDSRRSARRVSSDDGITAKVLRGSVIDAKRRRPVSHDDRCAQILLRNFDGSHARSHHHQKQQK